MSEAIIYDAVRTPRGKGKANGALHEVKPIDLTTGLLHRLTDRNKDFDPHGVDDVVLGCVTPVGDQGADIARTATTAAQWPETVAGVQINRFCASGLEAVNQAAARIRSGWEHLIIAGGVESMSRVPMGSDGGAWANDPATALANDFVPQGIGADLIATLEGFSRRDVDEYAARSQQRAAEAWSEGRFAATVEPVRDRNGLLICDTDETVRASTTVETLAELKPSFTKLGGFGFDQIALEKYHWVDHIDHVHHAGNSSGIVDGAALVMTGDEQAGERHGLRPRAKILATAVTGSDPVIMLTGPTPAIHKALSLTDLSAEDIDLWEINEAFAAIPMKVMKDFGIPADRVNVNGGAIAMGHPLGATGAMILSTLVDELERRDQRYGVVSLCIGGGMGIATIIERI